MRRAIGWYWKDGGPRPITVKSGRLHRRSPGFRVNARARAKRESDKTEKDLYTTSRHSNTQGRKMNVTGRRAVCKNCGKRIVEVGDKKEVWWEHQETTTSIVDMLAQPRQLYCRRPEP